MVRTHIATGLIGALAAVGAMLLASPADEGPWPVCQFEDGNPNGGECAWVNDGKVWYVDSSNYR